MGCSEPRVVGAAGVGLALGNWFFVEQGLQRSRKAGCGWLGGWNGEWGPRDRTVSREE